MTDHATVRVEVIDSSGDVVTGPEAPEPSSPDRRSLWLVVIVLVVLAVVLWWSARPEPGRSADDTPIVAPTSAPAAAPTTATLTTSTTSTTAPSTSVPDDGYERADLASPLDDVIEVDRGWFGLSRGPFGTTLLRSLDGLEWLEVKTNLPAGNLITVGQRRMGELVAVVGVTDRRIEIWESFDGAEWALEASHETPGISVWFGDVSSDSVLLMGNIFRPDPQPLSGAVEYLRRNFGATGIEEVCEVRQGRRTSTEGFDGFVFEDCRGESVFALTDDDIAEKPFVRTCLADVLDAQLSRLALITIDRDADPVIEQLPLFTFVSGMTAVPTGFVVSAGVSENIGDPDSSGLCFELDPAGFSQLLHVVPGQDATVLRTTRGTPGPFAVSDPTGRVLAVEPGSSRILAAEEPYVEWGEVAEADGPVIPSSDGRVIASVALVSQTTIVQRSDAGRNAPWFDTGLSAGATWPLFASSEHVYLVEFDAGGFSLVQVPLQG